MDEKQLKELMQYVAASDFVEFEYEAEGFKLRLVRGGGPARAADASPPLPAAAPASGLMAAPVPLAPAEPAPADGSEEITSPMVGTFYRAPNPNADPFVEVGDVVRAGQVICIVEAMKLMNEIEADRAGEIVEIPVANGQPVEYGETLFRIRPVA